MKCPKCNGKGDYFNEVFNDGKRSRKILVECDMCHGSGEVPMTNDEWRRTCSTEEFAKWLSKISKFFHECGKRDVYPKTMYEEDWERWLKEIHNG